MSRCQYVDKPVAPSKDVDAYDGNYIVKLFESKHLNVPIKFNFKNKGDRIQYLFNVADDGINKNDQEFSVVQMQRGCCVKLGDVSG